MTTQTVTAESTETADRHDAERRAYAPMGDAREWCAEVVLLRRRLADRDCG